MYRSVPGLENVEIVRPAYGVEYDHIDARELKREYCTMSSNKHITNEDDSATLETKRIEVRTP